MRFSSGGDFGDGFNQTATSAGDLLDGSAECGASDALATVFGAT